MTAKQVQFRRGTTAEYATFTGAVGEITVDTTAVTARVHDGSTVGGFPLAHAGANTDITSVLLDQTGLEVKGGSANTLTIKPNETLGADRTLNIVVNDANRTIDLSGNLTVSSAATISGTSSGTNTGDQNVFQTISVSGQSNVVADTATDTLTLVAGTNITITTDSATDSITFNATGPAVSNGDYGDITVSSSGTVWTIDNQAVTYAKIQNVSATDKILGRQTAGAGTVEEITCTAAGRALLDDATASDQRTTLGLGTIATQDANNVSITGGSITGITDLAIADGGTGASDAGTARTNLGLAIGTNVQAYDPDLSAIAGLATTDGNFIVGNGSTWVAESGATARTSLGLGTGDSPQFTAVNIGNASDTTLSRASAGNLAVEGNLLYRAGGTDVAIADGGTGASDAATARTNLGLGTGNGPTFAGVVLDNGAGTTRYVQYKTSGVIRWGVSANPTAETGANAGSDYGISRWADDGSFLSTPLQINRATGVTLLSELALTTDLALSYGGTGASLADPGADRIMFWDDSAGSVAWLTAGSGLTISGTTITASGTEFIGSGAVSGTSNLDFINISQYTTILVFYNFYNTAATRTLRVLLSSDNGSTFGGNRTIASLGTNPGTMSGLATISNTKASGTNKTITPSGAGIDTLSGTPALSAYTTAATESTVTGIINALRFNVSGTSAAFSVSIYGVL